MFQLSSILFEMGKDFVAGGNNLLRGQDNVNTVCSGITSIKWVGGGESDIESAAQRSNPSRLPRNDSSDGDGNSVG